MKTDKLELMEHGPVASSIIRLALPTMLAMAVQTIYSLTSTFFIGQTHNPLLVAAISLVSPLFYITQAMGNVFAVGSASLISRQLGAKKMDEAKQANAVSFYTTILVGVILTLVLLITKEGLLSRIGTSAGTYDAANEYFTIIAWFSIPMIMNITLAGQIRSEGAALQATIGMVLGIVVSIILDPIFILVMKLNAAGAAWATGAGSICTLCYFAYFYLSGRSILSISFKDFKPSRRIYAETLKIGGPAALSNIVMSGTMVLSNIVASGYGDALVAGIGVYMRVGGLCLSLLLGLTTGYLPFAGYNFGAQKYGRLISGFKATSLFATGLSCTFALIFHFFGEQLIRFFINDTPTVEAGNMLLHALVYAMPFVGIQLSLMVTFQALGQSIKAMVITLGRQCLFYIPLLYTLPKYFGVQGFVFAQPIADILTTIIAVTLSVSLFKQARVMIRQEQAEAFTA